MEAGGPCSTGTNYSSPLLSSPLVPAPCLHSLLPSRTSLPPPPTTPPSLLPSPPSPTSSPPGPPPCPLCSQHKHGEIMCRRILFNRGHHVQRRERCAGGVCCWILAQDPGGPCISSPHDSRMRGSMLSRATDGPLLIVPAAVHRRFGGRW